MTSEDKEKEDEEQKEIGPEHGVNDEVIQKSPVAKRSLEINQNDETEPSAKRVKEMIEEQVDDSDDEAPEEVFKNIFKKILN